MSPRSEIPPWFHRGLCRQLRDLVGAMFETEARMAEVMAGDGRTEPDRLKSSPLPWVAKCSGVIVWTVV